MTSGLKRSLILLAAAALWPLSNWAGWAAVGLFESAALGSFDPGAFLPLDRSRLIAAFGPPLGVVAVTVFCFSWEIWGLGWERSTAYKLLHPDTGSRKNDLFYTLIVLSGIEPALALLASLGLAHALEAKARAFFAPGLLSNWNFVPAFAVIFVVNSFLFYWIHRAMHSRFLWQIHKSHHSADEYSLILPHRNHPVDLAVGTALMAVPAALLGAPFIVTAAYLAFNGIYQQMVHSEMKWRTGFFEKFLISSQAHRIHHGKAPEFWGKNYGLLVFWDKLFGTYDGRELDGFSIGLDDEPQLNSGRPLAEFFYLYSSWLQGLFGLATKS